MLAEKPLDLPYRPCVGIMLINRAGLVWVGRRRPKWAGYGSAHIWQMPQGGITPGEGERAAALRELEEETGVASVELPAEATDKLQAFREAHADRQAKIVVFGERRGGSLPCAAATGQGRRAQNR